jgi:hypothetical protein
MMTRQSNAVFIISVKAGDKSLPLYVTEDDAGKEADTASQFIRDHGLPQTILNDMGYKYAIRFDKDDIIIHNK